MKHRAPFSRIRSFYRVILLLLILFGQVRSVIAQSAATLTPLQVAVSYDFGVRVVFEIQLDATLQLEHPRLLFQIEGQPYTQQLPLESLGEGRFRAEYTQVEALPPFGRVIFWIEAQRETQSFVSQRYRFRYLDNRFPWQTRQEGLIRLSWYDGDADFVRSALDTAQRGLQSIQATLGLTTDSPLELYLYASPADLQSSLVSPTYWESGHANPALGVALVAITPGPSQSLVMERLIPHELLHLLLYRQLGEGYKNQPIWLREGLAKLSELNPDPDAEIAIRQGLEQGSLIPIVELCQTFPLEAGRAYLAYAEALSFTRYLLQSYGKSTLQALFRAYADGLSCEQGILRVYGKPIDQLDREWRAAIGGNIVWQGVLHNLAPYLILLMLFLLLPVLLSLPQFAAPKKAPS